MRHPYQGTFKDGNGVIVAEGTISVFLAGTTTAADVYAASSGGSAVASVESATDGSFIFYVDDGDYGIHQLFKIILSETNYTSKTYDNIVVWPPWYGEKFGTSSDTTGTLASWGYSELARTGSTTAFVGTLGSAGSIGTTKDIVRSDTGAAACTVSVTKCRIADPTVLTLDAQDEWARLVWTGTEWDLVGGYTATT